ncbi:acyl-coenzyme A--6-aminopenicillanic-acid-acyltransferase [Streptomyces sp. SBT349]|uniref:acyl-coenzyme A--6-aminopenicillanic-acid-acyltransferase n=1 Tax=Streptomyces sp. SBT349 TaxID=1580539 RepID=UPI00066E420C|nr:acyl-coenzyme A--6-aminopenicillanic-acid-acyltransferase [Streptomyces sp. SBT349]
MPSPRVIDVSGPSAFDRGRQYGSAAADLIRSSIGYYRVAFERQAGLPWEQVLEYVQPWRRLIEDDFPDLLDEMRGIAEGAGVEPAEVVALNCRGEIMYDNWFTRPGAPRPTREETDGCTSFSLTGPAAGDGHVYTGQNWDWRHAVRDTVVLLRVVQPPKPTLVMQVEAGQVGRHGANSEGFALNANGLGGRFEDKVGVPQTVIRRAVLDAPNISDALRVLVRTRPHIASNALLTHRAGFSIDVETTPGAHGWEYPVDGVLVHGNHYQAFVPPQLAADHRPMSPDSLVRVPRAREGLRPAAGLTESADVRAAIHAAMSDHLGHPDSLCSHADPRLPEVDRWSTTVSSCVDLTSGDYYLAAGPPCENPYQLVPFNLYSEV